MRTYSTNYKDTFIEVADDCPVAAAETPPGKEPRTAARIQYDMLAENPYAYTSDDVLFESNGARRSISREDFFSKGQPCFRSSALTKRYGWGIHCNAEGRIALYAVDSKDYERLAQDASIAHIKAMRSGKK